MTSITNSSNFGHQVKQMKVDHKTPADVTSTSGEKEPFGKIVSVEAQSKEQVAEKTTVQTAKEQLNQSILKATLSVSVSAGNEPLSLLLKTAIEGINEALEPELGENAIQNAYDSGLDISPEATAERIVSLSTAFFGSYQEQHPELSDQEAATKFAEIIGGGIDTGFSEARDILDGLKVLEGEISSNIDKTYDLVQTGLKSFVDSFARHEEQDEKDENLMKHKTDL